MESGIVPRDKELWVIPNLCSLLNEGPVQNQPNTAVSQIMVDLHLWHCRIVWEGAVWGSGSWAGQFWTVRKNLVFVQGFVPSRYIFHLSWDCQTRAFLNPMAKSSSGKIWKGPIYFKGSVPSHLLEGASESAGMVKVEQQAWDVEGSRGCRWAVAPLLAYSFSSGGTLDCHHSKHSDQSSRYPFLAKDGLERPWCHLMGFLHYSVSDSLILFVPPRRKY